MYFESVSVRSFQLFNQVDPTKRILKIYRLIFFTNWLSFELFRRDSIAPIPMN